MVFKGNLLHGDHSFDHLTLQGVVPMELDASDDSQPLEHAISNDLVPGRHGLLGWRFTLIFFKTPEKAPKIKVIFYKK